jgi:hypothetical protein
MERAAAFYPNISKRFGLVRGIVLMQLLSTVFLFAMLIPTA